MQGTGTSKDKFHVFLSLAHHILKELRDAKELKQIQLSRSQEPVSRKMYVDTKGLIEQLYSEAIHGSSLSQVNESKKNRSSALLYIQQRDQSQLLNHALHLEQKHKLVTRVNLSQ